MKRTLALILAIAMALALVACGNKQAPSANSGDESVPNTGKTYEWDWCMTGGKTLMTEIATEMVEEIKTATNGQLNITVRLAGEMPYAVSEYLQATSDGSIAMAAATLSAAAVPSSRRNT